MLENEKNQNNTDYEELLKRLGSVQDLAGMGTGEVRRCHQKYLNPVLATLVRFIGSDERFIEAQGIHLKDDQGRSYLDFLSGFGAVNLGHEPPEVLEALRAVEGKPNILQAALNPYAGKLAAYLEAVTPGNLSRSFFANSGTEAVEAALKLARLVTRRHVLLNAEGGYHGKTYGALSVSGRKKYLS